MLRRQRQIRVQLHRLIDSGLFAFCFWFAYLVRANAGDFGQWPVQFLARFGSEPQILPFDTYLPLFLLVIPLSLFFLESSGIYQRALLPSRWRSILQFIQATFLVTVGLVFFMFVLKLPSARGLIVLFGAVSFIAMMIKEELYRAWLISRATNGALKKHLLLVGNRDETRRLRKELESRSSHDVQVLGEVDVRETSIDQLVELLHKKSPNGIVLAAHHTDFAHIESVIQACELEGVEVWLMADFFKTTISRTSVDDLHGRPILVFHSGPELSWQSVVKRAIDFSFALVALVVLAPVFLLVALIIRLTSKGQVFYSDVRSGLNGRPFLMHKFRSMVWNAEELKPALVARNEMRGPVFKVTNDPRVTRFGAFMRKFSVDELPQLYNVLRGEMSLVGPRPLVIGEVERFYDFAHRRRLSVKPGLACLWQVNGRSNLCEFNDWMRLDLDYIDNWSLWLDLKILARTIPTVLSGTGAK